MIAPVGFAVVGLGGLAQSAILPAFAGTQDARLVATVSRDAQKAERLAKQYGATHSYGSLEECLTNPAVEAVYIVTPPANHVVGSRDGCSGGTPCTLRKASFGHGGRSRSHGHHVRSPLRAVDDRVSQDL